MKIWNALMDEYGRLYMYLKKAVSYIPTYTYSILRIYLHTHIHKACIHKNMINVKKKKRSKGILMAKVLQKHAKT